MERKVLGRGLDALIPKKTAAMLPREFTYLSVSKIGPAKQQPRQEMSSKELTELAQSIKDRGFIQPIVVRKVPGGRFEVVAGERRYQAAKSLGLKEIPTIIKELDDKLSGFRRHGNLGLACPAIRPVFLRAAAKRGEVSLKVLTGEMNEIEDNTITRTDAQSSAKVNNRFAEGLKYVFVAFVPLLLMTLLLGICGRILSRVDWNPGMQQWTVSTLMTIWTKSLTRSALYNTRASRFLRKRSTRS